MSAGSAGQQREAAVGRGPRATEEALLEALAHPLGEGRADPSLLRDPVRVVVPAASLREHLVAAIARRFGAVAGVSVQTLYGLACQVVERAGGSAPPGDALFGVLVRQEAAREPALRDGLDALEDGYAGVVAVVSDLLDAGFTDALAEPIDERIVDAAPPGAARDRARALVGVASRCARAVEEGAVGHRSLVFRQAIDALALDASAALPARGVFVQGYGDATGIQADLIEALVRYRGARPFLDRPSDPADPTREDLGVAHSERFTARIAGVVPLGAPREGGRASVAVLHAPGPHAEVRAVAERVRAALDDGAVPERIGVVARTLEPYRLPLRLHFGRLAIPFSGVGARGPADAAGRRLAALQELLRRGERAHAETWLDALASAAPGDWLSDTRRADLRVAFHARGAARLADVAALPADGERVSLPVRRGVSVREDGGAPVARRRSLPGEVFAAAVRAAGGLCGRLLRWPSGAPLSEHVSALRAVVEDDLRWPAGDPAAAAVAELGRGEAGRRPDLPLTRAEFLLFLARALEGVGLTDLGGAGAGVQVLDVMEARSRTFDRLFVLGLNRDVFPRPITEEPLLPDRLRRVLREVLPDLPVKSEGFEEERYLFAQLLAASPDVTLSCAVSDDDGVVRQPSPLLERLRACGAPGGIERVPTLHAPRAADGSRGASRRPAHEHALLAGLYGGLPEFTGVLEVALAEARGAQPPDGALARSRAAVIAELSRPARGGAGPYLGFVGPARDAADPRRADRFVTALEGAVYCPWQAFLTRLLRLERLPDALDALPGDDPRIVGSVVHDALERVVRAACGDVGALERASDTEPTPVPWPGQVELERILRESAAVVAFDEGITLPGFARVLARRARPYVEAARDLDWPGGSAPHVLGAELTGSFELASGHRLHFRADRVDRVGGTLVLTDYKTGKPPSEAAGAKARRDAVEKRIGSGVLLQAAAYARAAPGARGRYAYLRPDLYPDRRAFEVDGGEEAILKEFEAVAAAVLSAFECGGFTPRLADAQGLEPRACQTCEVKEACLRGDTGARARVFHWLGDRASSAAPAEVAARGILCLGGRR